MNNLLNTSWRSKIFILIESAERSITLYPSLIDKFNEIIPQKIWIVDGLRVVDPVLSLRYRSRPQPHSRVVSLYLRPNKMTLSLATLQRLGPGPGLLPVIGGLKSWSQPTVNGEFTHLLRQPAINQQTKQAKNMKPLSPRNIPGKYATTWSWEIRSSRRDIIE